MFAFVCADDLTFIRCPKVAVIACMNNTCIRLSTSHTTSF